MRIINGEYLLSSIPIMWEDSYDESVDMAVYVNKQGKIRYLYWQTLYLPRMFKVEL